MSIRLVIPISRILFSCSTPSIWGRRGEGGEGVRFEEEEEEDMKRSRKMKRREESGGRALDLQTF